MGRALREKQIPFWKDKWALKGRDGRSDSFPPVSVWGVVRIFYLRD